MMIPRFDVPSLFLLLTTMMMMTASNAFYDLDPNHLYEAPTDITARSPCPALNVLANHGYLPRSGTNVSSDDLLTQLEEVLGIPKPSGMLPWMSAVSRGLKTTTDDDDTYFDFVDLYECCDHDSSLVRQDKYFVGEAQPQFDETLWAEMKTLAITSNDTSFMTPQEMSQHQYNRIVHSRINNPEFDGSNRFPIILTGDILSMTVVLADPVAGVVPMSFLEAFLGPNALADGFVPFKDRGIELTSTENPMVTMLNEFYFMAITAALTANLSNFTNASAAVVVIDDGVASTGGVGLPPTDEEDEADTPAGETQDEGMQTEEEEMPGEEEPPVVDEEDVTVEKTTTTEETQEEDKEEASPDAEVGNAESSAEHRSFSRLALILAATMLAMTSF